MPQTLPFGSRIGNVKADRSIDQPTRSRRSDPAVTPRSLDNHPIESGLIASQHVAARTRIVAGAGDGSIRFGARHCGRCQSSSRSLCNQPCDCPAGLSDSTRQHIQAVSSADTTHQSGLSQIGQGLARLTRFHLVMVAVLLDKLDRDRLDMSRLCSLNKNWIASITEAGVD